MTLVQAVLCVIVVGLALAFARGCLSSPLDNIPAPASFSLFTGLLHILWNLHNAYQVFYLGNLSRLLDTHLGWNYNRELSDRFGPVFRIHGPLGVRCINKFLGRVIFIHPLPV